MSAETRALYGKNLPQDSILSVLALVLFFTFRVRSSGVEVRVLELFTESDEFALHEGCNFDTHSD